jgi:8-oxo-dGTP pyrophosphatase MutT (NUDIX family)
LSLDPDHIQTLLAGAPTVHDAAPPDAPQAAVLVLLCPGSGGPVTILTRRSEELPLHAGQISLPGGRVDRRDTSLEATALREASEETGLDPALVRVLGRLPVTTVSSGFVITPVVAWAETRPDLKAEPREVVELIDCPLALALDPAAYKTDFMVRDEVKREFYYIEFNGYYVWGATARVLRSLALLMAEAARR